MFLLTWDVLKREHLCNVHILCSSSSLLEAAISIVSRMESQHISYKSDCAEKVGERAPVCECERGREREEWGFAFYMRLVSLWQHISAGEEISLVLSIFFSFIRYCSRLK